jgi:ADP-heptose:LPS heptosyltransferase
MRILASNPDSIGDLVLRQPMYAALREAGHEVTLIVRAGWLPIVQAVAPGAEVLVLPIDPYTTAIDWGKLQQLVEAAVAVEPDVLLMASYQWTAFEEGLAERLPGVRTVGMSGKLFAGDPRLGVQITTKMALSTRVEVAESAPELAKNELLCSALLGRAVRLPRPRLAVTEGQQRAGAMALSRSGLVPGGYWVACVGHHEFTRVRNWGTGKWAEALGYWARAYGRKFLLVGTEPEGEALREVARGVERECPGATALGEGLDLDGLVGVTEVSAGYVGRDTGPMHIAAACGKPVIAVFGGGTWPRFLPAAEPSRTLTVNVPCAGCDWICNQPESVCVKGVTVERVVRAIDDMERGRIAGAEVDAVEPDSVLLAGMLREAGVSYRKVLVRASREEAAGARGEELARELAAARERVAAEEERTAVAVRLTEELRGRLYKEESAAADLRVKLAQARAEQEVMEGAIRQMEVQTQAEVEAARKRATAARKKLERISTSRWMKLGKMLGLKLESAGDADPQSRGRGGSGETRNPKLEDRNKPEARNSKGE